MSQFGIITVRTSSKLEASSFGDQPGSSRSRRPTHAGTSDLHPRPASRSPAAPVTTRSPPAPESRTPGQVLALWFSLSGMGLTVLTFGAWLLVRSRKNRL